MPEKRWLPDAHAEHFRGLAWSHALLGPLERMSWDVKQACHGEVFLLNPMAGGKDASWKLNAGAVTDAMDDLGVPREWRSDVRSNVKLLHDIDYHAGDNSPSVRAVCLCVGIDSEREWNPDCNPHAGKCAAYFDGILG